MIKTRLVSLGARIPSSVKEQISSYCDRNGVKLQFFVTEAILEKLADMEHDEIDNKIVDERSVNPQFTTKSKLKEYLQKRKRAV